MTGTSSRKGVAFGSSSNLGANLYAFSAARRALRAESVSAYDSSASTTSGEAGMSLSSLVLCTDVSTEDVALEVVVLTWPLLHLCRQC